MSLASQKELESAYMLTTYGRKPVEFVRGKGMRLYDSDGKEYLDFLSGIGAVCLGHANEAVADAIASQAHTLMQVGNFFYVEGRGELARDLSEFLNGESKDASPWKTFFANSGAEANEGAIKLARKYGKLHLDGAGTLLTAKRSFHGRTLMTTAATGQEAKQESFTPMPLGCCHFDPGDTRSLIHLLELCEQAAEREGQPELAPVAVMLECVQGEGGVWYLGEEYLREVRDLTRERGLLLIIDEVQTGFYRTGKPFSYMHADIRPDVVTMAKGIANGFPCGAFAATGKASEVLVPGEHGSTFGGSPLAIAAARATLAELQSRDMGMHVVKMEQYLRKQLEQLPQVKEVRGIGLMLALSLAVPCAVEIIDDALARGLVINSIGNEIVRFLPPLIVSEPEVDELITILKELLEEH